MPITKREQDSLTTAIATFVTRLIKEDRVRLAALEQRLAGIEAKPHLKFCGTYQRGTTYTPGDAVVRDGSLWVCKAETSGAPTEDFVGWQQAVRKGRDGKDLRP